MIMIFFLTVNLVESFLAKCPYVRIAFPKTFCDGADESQLIVFINIYNH